MDKAQQRVQHILVDIPSPFFSFYSLVCNFGCQKLVWFGILWLLCVIWQSLLERPAGLITVWIFVQWCLDCPKHAAVQDKTRLFLACSPHGPRNSQNENESWKWVKVQVAKHKKSISVADSCLVLSTYIYCQTGDAKNCIFVKNCISMEWPILLSGVSNPTNRDASWNKPKYDSGNWENCRIHIPLYPGLIRLSYPFWMWKESSTLDTLALSPVYSPLMT